MGNIWFREALGRERCDSGNLPRHRHSNGYMTLVLSGGYLEAGDAGRFRASAGDLLFHAPFEAHRDCFGRGSAEVLNLPMAARIGDTPIGKVADPDAVARAAESSLHEAAQIALCGLAPSQGEKDWPDALAALLGSADTGEIGSWARHNGLAPATVSRGFRQAFGTTPARYRAEARARRAWRAIVGSGASLAEIAAETGFADQAHMTRLVAAVTGLSPGRWRQVKPVQYAARSAL